MGGPEALLPQDYCLSLRLDWPTPALSGLAANERAQGSIASVTTSLFPGHFGVVYHGEYTDQAQNLIHCAVKSLSREWGRGWQARTREEAPGWEIVTPAGPSPHQATLGGIPASLLRT